VPELPEVETTRRALADGLEGAKVRSVVVKRDRMVRRQARPGDFAQRLVGRMVESVGRTGKFLMTQLSEDLTWVTHLGMSGRLRLVPSPEPQEPHTNIVVTMGSGIDLRFIDPRTFGFMAVFTPQELENSSLARLGPDALDHLPTARSLQQRLANRTAPIKALLLDQNLVAGLGNIYADEVLHRAQVRPDRQGGSLDAGEVKALRSAVRPVLNAGLRWGGTSLDDLAYLLPDGSAGQYLDRLKVYGREDEPCRRCGTPIRRAMLRGRSTHWCPSCQK